MIHSRPIRASRNAALCLTFSAAACAAFAQSRPQTPSQPQINQPLASVIDKAEVKRQNGIPYVTGGISDAGQSRTRSLGSDMSLAFVFAKASGGNYVADVDVSISDKSGNKVLDVRSADPLLYAQLPPGSYKITAVADGKTIVRNVDISAKGQHTENFSW